MPLPHLLAIGGAHIDRRGQVSDTYIPGTSNPGRVSEEVGGVVFNALRNAAMRNVAASLLSVRGGDAAGESVERAIREAGITDLSAVFLDRATPSYTALLDREGGLIAGLADMALYDAAFPKQMDRAKVRAAVAEVDAVLCDANLPTAALRKLSTLATGRMVFAIAISPAKAVRLAGLLPSINCLFMNLAEARSLSGLDEEAQPVSLAATLKARGLPSGVLTAGAGPVICFDVTGIFCIEPPIPRRIADVTGAGDALSGATISALMTGQPLRNAVREGMAAAMLTVESKAAVVNLEPKAFAEALALVPKAKAAE